MKPYSFKFKLPAQIQTSQASAGLLDFSVLTTAGTVPLNNTKRTVYPSASGLAGFYDIAYATTFQLADIRNVAAWAQMFDAYKIMRVGCSIEYLNNVSAVNSTGLMPSLYTYWDQDDANIPLSVVQIQGKQGVRRQQFGNKGVTSYKTSARPHVAQDVLAAGGSIAAIVGKSQWLDCVSTDVQHYALKMVITDVYLPGSSAVTQAFRFNWTYDVCFRAPLLTA